MKIKIILFSSLFLFSFVVSAQVAINTHNANHSAVLLIDGLDDNSTQSVWVSSENDIIVDLNGNVGVGTVTPTAKLDIDSRGHNKGALRIVDGSVASSNRKLVMTCLDDEGTGSWQQVGALAIGEVQMTTPEFQFRVGDYMPPAGNDFNDFQNYVFHSTGITIKVPPGKWLIDSSIKVMKVSGNNAATAYHRCWMRSTLTDGSNPTKPTADIESWSPMLISTNLYAYSANATSMLTGFLVVNNKSGADKTYQYRMGAIDHNTRGFNIDPNVNYKLLPADASSLIVATYLGPSN